MMRRPMAIIMTFVMLLGTVITYAPALAEDGGDGPKLVYDMFVGEQKYNEILDEHGAQHMLLEGQVGQVLDDETEIVGIRVLGIWLVKRVKDLEGLVYEEIAATIHGTSDFDEGQYTLILLKEKMDPSGDPEEPEYEEIRVTLNVEVNDPPLAENDFYPADIAQLEILEDSEEIVLPVLSNDTDPDGPYMMITGLAESDEGFRVEANQLKYKPPANFHGTASTQYIITDGTSMSRATVEVTVTSVVDPPLAKDDTAIISEDQKETIDVARNDDKPEGPWKIRIVNLPAHGDAWLVADDTKIRYNPSPSWNPDFVGFDTIEYEIYEVGNMSNSDRAILTLDVRNTDDNNLNAGDDYLDVFENGQASTNVLDNDIGSSHNRITADIYSINIVSSPEHGSAGVNLDGVATYYAGPDFDGEDEFKYGVTLITGEYDEATVYVNVLEDRSINLGDDVFMINEDSGWVELDVLENDVIKDGILNIWVRPWMQAEFGEAKVENGKVMYKPNDDFNGVDVFRYMVRDGDGKRDTAGVLVTVNPMKDLYPVDPIGPVVMDKDESHSFNPVDILDIDFVVVDGMYENVALGEFDEQSNGMITFDADDRFAGSFTATYHLYNASGDEITGNVTYDVGLFSDRIAIYLDPIEGQSEFDPDLEGYFVQQGDMIDLFTGVTYGLVGAHPVTVKAVDLHMTQGTGYVDPAEERLFITDGPFMLTSYGTILLSYFAQDEPGHVGTSMPRKLTVNHQPQISLLPINPSDPWAMMQTTVSSPSIEIDYKEGGWSLDELVYLYDFEEYPTNFLDPITNEPIPDGFVVKFIHDGMEYDLDQFWQVFAIGQDDDPSDDLPIDTMIQLVARDNSGGEGFSSDIPLRINNNEPELTVEDQYILLNEGDAFNMLQGVSAYDLEDTELGLMTNITWDIEIVGIEEWPESEPLLLIDTSISGIYVVTYTATDVMGDTDIKDQPYQGMRFVLVMETPVITLDPETVEIEPMGQFPIWNGVFVDFWAPGELLWEDPDALETPMDTAESHTMNPDWSLKAFIGDPDDPDSWVEAETLWQFQEEGTYYINYVAYFSDIDVDYYREMRYLAGHEEMFYSKSMVTRTVVVSDDDMGDLVYMSDFMPYGAREFMQVNGGPMDDISLYDWYHIYPVLYKYNPVTMHERLVSAFTMPLNMPMMNSRDHSDVDYLAHYAFDDIAVVPHPETGEDVVYGLIDYTIYAFDLDTMSFEPIVNIIEELHHFLFHMTTASHYEEIMEAFTVQAMTVDANGNLVIPVALEQLKMMMLDNELPSILDYEHLILYFDPYGIPVIEEGNGIIPDSEPPMRYIVGVGIVNDDGIEMAPKEQIEQPVYPPMYYESPVLAFTDAAYSGDFDELYMIGTYHDYYRSVSDMDSEGMNSMDFGDRFNLMSFIETDYTDLHEFQWIQNELQRLPQGFMIKYFDLEDERELMPGNVYSGIATLGEDIYVTGFMSPRLYMGGRPDMEMPDFFQTTVYNYQYDDGEFMNQEMMNSIDGMFYGAWGAASTFVHDFVVTPTSQTVVLNYQESASMKVEFTDMVFPEAVYSDRTWTVASNASRLQDPSENADDETNDGVFYVDDTFTSDSNVRIDVTAYNSYTRMMETRTVYIDIDYRTPPPAPAPAAIVGVTLDTDAVTLAYGGTAEEELTFYDFTETVTGTTNTAVTWALDDDTFAEVDENGLVTVKDDVEVGTGDIIVEVTVTTVVGNATASATVLFEEQTPLGAIEFFDPYIFGYSDNTFRPKNFVTRAEVATMFTKILNLNTEFPGSQKFYDVTDDHWAYTYIQAMFRTGLFVGSFDQDGNRIFDPNAPISRAEIAQVFSNYWNFLDISVTGVNTSPIPDVSDGFWASSAINRLYNTGIFTGYSDGSFKPYEPTLREQIVNMINALINRPPNEPETSKFTDIEPADDYYGDIEAASQTFLKPQEPQGE